MFGALFLISQWMIHSFRFTINCEIVTIRCGSTSLLYYPPGCICDSFRWLSAFFSKCINDYGLKAELNAWHDIFNFENHFFLRRTSFHLSLSLALSFFTCPKNCCCLFFSLKNFSCCDLLKFLFRSIDMMEDIWLNTCSIPFSNFQLWWWQRWCVGIWNAILTIRK